MADYNTLYYIWQNAISAERLWRQAYVAIRKAAIAIENESEGTSNHANRLVWATSAKSDPDSAVIAMKAAILDNATIAADPNGATDNDVQFVVNSLIDTFATGS